MPNDEEDSSGELEPDADDAVIGRVLGGDRGAYRILVERYQASVFRLVRSFVTPANVDDLAQDVFLSAYLALGDFDRTRGRFGTWLYTIARNKCLNARKRKEPFLFAEPPTQVSPKTPCDALTEKVLFQSLDRALDELPVEQKTAFVLREFVGLMPDEIARIERVDGGTLRSRLSRARARLRAVLGPLLGEEP